jgi:hypothetical protein
LIERRSTRSMESGVSGAQVLTVCYILLLLFVVVLLLFLLKLSCTELVICNSRLFLTAPCEIRASLGQKLVSVLAFALS